MPSPAPLPTDLAEAHALILQQREELALAEARASGAAAMIVHPLPAFGSAHSRAQSGTGMPEPCCATWMDSTQHPSAQCSAFSRKTSGAAGSAFLGWFVCKLRDVDG